MVTGTGVIQSGPNKDRFKKTSEGAGDSSSRFKGCVQTQISKGLSPEAARRLCGFIARNKG